MGLMRSLVAIERGNGEGSVEVGSISHVLWECPSYVCIRSDFKYA